MSRKVQQDAYAMSEADKDTLRENGVFLLKNVDPSNILLRYLVQQDILTENMCQEIKTKQTTHDKVDHLMFLLPRRGPKAFQEFINGLMVSENRSAAKKLSPSLAAKWSRLNERPPTQESSGAQDSSGAQGCGSSSHSSSREQRPIQESSAVQSTSHVDGASAPEDSINQPFPDVNITNVNPQDPAIRKIISNNKENYRMSKRVRGRAVVINYTRDRKGNEYDVTNIITLFRALHFSPILHQDKEMAIIKQIIKKESEDAYHKSSECFVLFIMGHGSKGVIKTDDGQLNIKEDIIIPFTSDKCKNLAGTPKIFFIQSCQKEPSSDFGSLEDGDDSDPQPDLVQPLKDLSIAADSGDRHHPMDDILVAYATVPGYLSFRVVDLGSWFVRSVVEVFSQFAHEDDLRTLLGKVRSRVKSYAHKYQFLVEDPPQLTRTDDTTAKRLFFLPGYFA